ncbi:MAG TPA: DNA ligase D, partial [Patescibacteria group bacterium]|nr:DNA ligase D [Patescibacteria group bacterium]
AKGLEGIVAKRLDAPYHEGSRSDQWLKIKIQLRQEAVIGGYTEGRGSRKQFGSLILGVYEGDRFIYIGHTGGGFDDASLKIVKEQLKPLETTRSPFAETPKTNAPAHWVKPRLMCEIKFSEWTDDGHVRQPIFLGLREDKDPKKVRRERPEVAVPSVPPGRRVYAKEALKQDDLKRLKIGGRELEITHWHKIFFPEDRITKGDLVKYYRSMAKWILPYLKDRPESMNRFPNGIDEEHFYQKDAPDVLEWVKRVSIHSDTEERNLQYIVCSDEATLVYLVQLGCIELNPWNSRVGSLDTPDYLALDLDPEGIEFAEVVKTAQTAKKVLDSIQAPAYCKTSGATGLHIYVPLAPQYTYEQVRLFAEILANKIHRLLPHTTSLARSPTERQKHVYLDYLQNRRGQTMAAPYAVRPRPGATVSTPLKWTEVRKGLDPRRFTLRNSLARVERVGDLWTPTQKGRFRLEDGMKRL